MLSRCRTVGGGRDGHRRWLLYGENVSSCLQATLSSSAVACGGHRSVRVSHYTSRSVTLAQGSGPICRQKAWLEQFLPEVVSCQREASLSVMAMGHGRVNMRFNEKQARGLPTLKPRSTTLDPFGLSLEGPWHQVMPDSLGQPHHLKPFQLSFLPSRTHSAIIRKVIACSFLSKGEGRKTRESPIPQPVQLDPPIIRENSSWRGYWGLPLPQHRNTQ